MLPVLLGRADARHAESFPLKSVTSNICDGKMTKPAEIQSEIGGAALAAIVAAMRNLGYQVDQFNSDDLDRGFFEYGLDSLEAGQLQQDLGVRLGRALPATLLFDYPSLGSLAQKLDQVCDDRQKLQINLHMENPQAADKIDIQECRARAKGAEHVALPASLCLESGKSFPALAAAMADLGYLVDEQEDLDVGFCEYGLDSLEEERLRDGLCSRLSVKLPLPFLFDSPNMPEGRFATPAHICCGMASTAVQVEKESCPNTLQQVSQCDDVQDGRRALAHCSSAVGQAFDLIQQILSELGYCFSEPLDSNIGFFELGLVSLDAYEFRNRLTERLAVDLPATILFDYPTAHSLSEKLAGLFPNTVQDVSSHSSNAQTTEFAASESPARSCRRLGRRASARTLGGNNCGDSERRRRGDCDASGATLRGIVRGPRFAADRSAAACVQHVVDGIRQLTHWSGSMTVRDATGTASSPWDRVTARELWQLQGAFIAAYSSQMYQNEFTKLGRRCFPDICLYVRSIEPILVEVEGPLLLARGLASGADVESTQTARKEFAACLLRYWAIAPEIRTRAMELIRLTKQDQL
eukprot:TRINITY_DN11683_c0_g2_i3.p1 TRINITY_DN11683_c0_g2~~TRINITY_DN11683_c0_g2_i3.p1  ORF type:complete len:581 (+),score=85.65 TRINITY_DN11683_c0_g2_i3:188-1930(+)